MFKDICQSYFDNLDKRHVKSVPRVVSRISTPAKHLFNRRADAISTHDIEQMHRKIGTDNGEVLANRILVVMRDLQVRDRSGIDSRDAQPRVSR